MKHNFAKISILFLCLLISNTYAQDNKGKQPANPNNGMISDTDAKKAIDDFEKQIKKAKTEDEAVSAIGALGSVKHPKILDELKKQAKYYKSTNKVKIACVNEIAKYTNDKTAAGYLSDIFDSNYRSKDTKDVAVAALGAISSIAYEPSAKQLLKVIDDKDDDIAVAAVEAEGEIRSKIAIAPLIQLLKRYETMLNNVQAQQSATAAQQAKAPPPSSGGKGSTGGNKALSVYKQQNGLSGTDSTQMVEQQRAQKMQPAISKSLSSITRQTFTTAKDWDNWWSNNKATFKVPQ